jgi:hypothetical protein
MLRRALRWVRTYFTPEPPHEEDSSEVLPVVYSPKALQMLADVEERNIAQASAPPEPLVGSWAWRMHQRDNRP